MSWIDTHAHLERFQRDGTLKDVLARAKEADISSLIWVGSREEANTWAVECATANPAVWAAVGYDRDTATEQSDMDALEALLVHSRVVGVGEVGLDYHYNQETASQQCRLLEKMLDRAAAHTKPVIIHTRDAFDDTFSLLQSYANQWTGDPGRVGVIHCFTGSRTEARHFIDLGFMISFSGITTFATAHNVRDTASYVPMDRLLIETDSPYLAPIPHRGKQNEPSFVPHVGEQLAKIHHVTSDQMAETTTRNAQKLFGLE